MKINKKVLIITLVTILTIINISSTIFAATLGTTNIINTKGLGAADTKMRDIGSMIFTTITNIGVVLAVVIIAILGVKYMMGSAEERAEYKKTMMPYIIGAVLVFGASTIGRMVYNLAKNIK